MFPDIRSTTKYLVAMTAVAALSTTGCSVFGSDEPTASAPIDTTVSTVQTVSTPVKKTSQAPTKTVAKPPVATPTQAPPPLGNYNVFSGPNYTNRVVLTFDDCPTSIGQLKQTTAAAKAHNIGMVLAPIGQCIQRFGPQILDIMRSNGQYVINHSISHPTLTSLSLAGVERELGAPGVVTNYGRPPYGEGYFTHPPNATVAAGYAAVGMKPWLWTVDTSDWRGGSAGSIVSYVVNNSGAGDTVLMHMNHNAFNPESIVAMQQGLKARGLEVCRAYPGTSPVMLPDSLPC